MVGESVGRIVESKSKKYEIGNLVTIHQGWQTFIRAKDSDPSLQKVPKSNLQSSVFLGAIGMPGRTAYYGPIICSSARHPYGTKKNTALQIAFRYFLQRRV